MGRRDDLVAEETTMATDDRCVTIQPYFEVKDGEMDDVRGYLERLVGLTRSEPACLYYGFSICGNRVHCREGYTDAAGALAHLENVGSLLQELLGTGKAELADLQIHGPEQELAKMREQLTELGPSYWVLEYGFRN
jgi:quinol monooxygenase YgiN